MYINVETEKGYNVLGRGRNIQTFSHPVREDASKGQKQFRTFKWQRNGMIPSLWHPHTRIAAFFPKRKILSKTKCRFCLALRSKHINLSICALNCYPSSA